MIFRRRRWANRIVKKAGFSNRSPEATVIVDQLIWASKQDRSGLPVAEEVIISALRMLHNQTAVVKVAEELAVSPAAAESALAKLPQAALAVATEHGMHEFVKVVERGSPA